MFKEALRDGTAECYLPLSCHFDAQAEPATCGLGTLAMILNAMGIPPPSLNENDGANSDVAAGIRRRDFWTETNLPVGRPWPYILKHGTDMDDVAATARKAGIDVTLVHARVDNPPDAAFNKHLHQPHGRQPLGQQITTLPHAGKGQQTLPTAQGSPNRPPLHSHSPLGQDTFRKVVQAASRRANADTFVAMSFSRTALYQTGEGHFSPLGAYHKASDSVLVLESAKFKYPPHWVPVPLMWAAMQRTDWVTGRPRGYLVLSKKGAEPLDY
jgi:Phytochelatin synthase